MNRWKTEPAVFEENFTVRDHSGMQANLQSSFKYLSKLAESFTDVISEWVCSTSFLAIRDNGLVGGATTKVILFDLVSACHVRHGISPKYPKKLMWGEIIFNPAVRPLIMSPLYIHKISCIFIYSFCKPYRTNNYGMAVPCLTCYLIPLCDLQMDQDQLIRLLGLDSLTILN